MKVIHLGANIPASGNKQHATRDNAKYGRYLLAVGTIEPRKNYRLLLDAFKQIKNTSDVNLLIVGKPGWLADEIDQAIRTHPDFSTRVFLLQGISDDQLDQLYRHAWLTVIPSIYEGFGLPLVESLARNCPTISSTGGSLSEIGADLVGFFSPHSANQLSTLILELDSNPKAYEDLLNKAKNFVPPRWQDMVLEIDRHLHDLSLLELSPPERDEQGAQ